MLIRRIAFSCYFAASGQLLVVLGGGLNLKPTGHALHRPSFNFHCMQKGSSLHDMPKINAAILFDTPMKMLDNLSEAAVMSRPCGSPFFHNINLMSTFFITNFSSSALKVQHFHTVQCNSVPRSGYYTCS